MNGNKTWRALNTDEGSYGNWPVTLGKQLNACLRGTGLLIELRQNIFLISNYLNIRVNNLSWLHLLVISAGLRNSNAILLGLTINTMESILLEVATEFDVFTLKLALHIRNKKPRDDGASHGKCGTNKENTLNALFVIMK